MTAQELQSIYDNMPSDKKVAFTQMIEESVLPYLSTSQYDIHEKVLDKCTTEQILSELDGFPQGALEWLDDNELLYGWLEKELL